MSTLPYFSSVPGMAVPGMAQPGRDQRFSYPLYLYEGQAACVYMDYLDVTAGHALAPVPGGYYTMAVASSRAGLTVPPPGRPWSSGNAGAGGAFAPLLRRPLSAAEIIAAREQALAAHGHYPESVCRQCDPAPAEPPPLVRRVDGPDFAPGPSLAEVRADLERARVAHGHYAAGGCRQCMSGGREG